MDDAVSQSGLLGPASEALLERVDRAIAEARRGAPIVVTGLGGAVVARAAETVEIGGSLLPDWSGLGPARIAVTGRRAALLGLGKPTDAAVVLMSETPLGVGGALSLIDPALDEGPRPPPGISALSVTTGTPTAGALRLMKIARLLPAAVVAKIETDDAAAWAAGHDRALVDAEAIANYDQVQAELLEPVSEARVPLAGAADTRIVSFRPRDGGVEHLAIVVGEPDTDAPVLVRLHSECFTGDLLGSLKCDCGDQLRGAIDRLAQEGSGVLLYLAQEGRGIGLVNKLRAYELQDKGFDTVDANEQLGFDDDERVYQPAVRMLRCLGIGRVRLLTNNPAKVGALARHGIEVTERVAHVFPSNEHNWAYLQTKAKRSGHLL